MIAETRKCRIVGKNNNKTTDRYIHIFTTTNSKISSPLDDLGYDEFS